jgi:hypothetical protein
MEDSLANSMIKRLLLISKLVRILRSIHKLVTITKITSSNVYDPHDAPTHENCSFVNG